jgi:hypothetical protein
MCIQITHQIKIDIPSTFWPCICRAGTSLEEDKMQLKHPKLQKKTECDAQSELKISKFP